MYYVHACNVEVKYFNFLSFTHINKFQTKSQLIGLIILLQEINNTGT